MSDDVIVGEPVYVADYLIGDPVEIAAFVDPSGDFATEDEVDEKITTALTAHVIDPTPHPEYDDIPSLVLLFENRLV